MRKKIFFGLLAVALATASLFPISKSGAAHTYKDTDPIVGHAKPKPISPPDFDIRLADKGEFQDYDLSSVTGQQRAAQNIATRTAVAAVAQFQASSNSAPDVHAIVNETGAMKNFFIDGAPLSQPSADTPDHIARNFLNQHPSLFQLSAPDVANLKLTKEDLDEGTTFLTYVQRIGSLKVFDGDIQVVVNNSGEILSVREGFLVTGQSVELKSQLTEAQALSEAFEHAGRNIDGVFAKIQGRAARGDISVYANPLGSNYENVLSDLVVLRVGDNARLAWHVSTDVGPSEWYEILLDAKTGELLFRHNLYVFEAQGTVYTVHPDFGQRQLVSFVGDTIINTSAGWMGTSTVTTGNNVEAYLDTDANNLPDPNNGSGLSNGHAFSASQDFTFPFSTGVDPRTQQAAVVTNLFYFNNVMHDFSYGLGFTETAGNFQTNNFGRGGLGSDSVMGEAQDGSGVNNANFATPPDGQRPRMQQYLFTAPDPDRDSSLDSDVVFHEYGHGISNRLIGNTVGLGGIQSGAMGEGWSDYWGNTLNNEGVVGEYVTDNPTSGIRRAAYTVPAATIHDSYADVGNQGFEVHNDGEIWAATLWDLRTQLGKTITDRIVLNGMKFTPTHPSFLNARDGILQADQSLNAGVNRCALWNVFARHGMGVSAVGNDGTTHVAATNTPTDCSCTYTLTPTSLNFPTAGGSGSFMVTTGSTCTWTATVNAAWISITSGSSGTGNGTVNYTVAANGGSSSRTGTITVNGQVHTITQDGNTCTYSISPTSQSFSSSGGSSSFAVTTASGCAWSAISNNSWITTTSSGNGNGTVNYNVAANTGASRTGTITVNGQTHTVTQAGTGVLIKKRFDYDGDGKSDISVWRRSNGNWFIINSGNGSTTVQQWGENSLGDDPVAGDFDGDGKTDIAVWRASNGTWYISNSSGFVQVQQWGEQSLGDIPTPADFDGDGNTDFAVWRASNGTWYVLNSSTGSVTVKQWGEQSLGDKPVAADYDGDGKADIAAWRALNGTWYITNSSNGSVTVTQWGEQSLGDVPVNGDFDGDGKTDIAVWRASNQVWYYIASSDGSHRNQQWGAPGDIPTPADFDGDGKADIAVWRPSNGTWYISNSSNGSVTVTQWGEQSLGDVPIPAFQK